MSAHLNQKTFSRGCPEERQQPEMPAGWAAVGLSEQKGSKVQVQVQLKARRAVECLRRHLGARTQARQGLHVGALHSQGGGRRRGPRLHLGARSKPNETVKLGPGPKAVSGGRGCPKERRRPAKMCCTH